MIRRYELVGAGPPRPPNGSPAASFATLVSCAARDCAIRVTTKERERERPPRRITILAISHDFRERFLLIPFGRGTTSRNAIIGRRIANKYSPFVRPRSPSRSFFILFFPFFFFFSFYRDCSRLRALRRNRRRVIGDEDRYGRIGGAFSPSTSAAPRLRLRLRFNANARLPHRAPIRIARYGTDRRAIVAQQDALSCGGSCVRRLRSRRIPRDPIRAPRQRDRLDERLAVLSFELR